MNDNDRGFALGPDPLSNGFVDNRDKRISALEAENAALKVQVVALKADNDVFSRYVRDNMALVAHDDRCVVCEHGGHCSEREALEKDDWKSFGEVMQIYQRRSALATEVKA